MTLTTERLKWLHDAATELSATKLKMTMRPDELLVLTSELLANREAQPVAYFAAAPDYGWDMFKNKEDAIATCQAEIDAYRDCRDDGWDDDVQRVCWGVVMQKAEGFDLQGLHTSNSNHTYQTCDYSLHPVTATATPTPAVNASQDFEAWFVEKYKQPARLMKNGDGTYKFSGVQMAFSAWSDGRAAMLAQPVSSSYTLPEGGNDHNTRR
ncbi:hypothetical protein [Serratia marcescens]|uniref:hypothetical protein n=1 Tax=Serratia marcescens TaxID=615 RepID=UPI0013D9546A|nr:hypothetical protein [Serratia marcescens]